MMKHMTFSFVLIVSLMLTLNCGENQNVEESSRPGDVEESNSEQSEAVEQTYRHDIAWSVPESISELPENMRMNVYREIWNGESRASEGAIRRYPNDIDAQSDYESVLYERYMDEIAQKYNITRQQLWDIGTEGVVKQWPH